MKPKKRTFHTEETLKRDEGKKPLTKAGLKTQLSIAQSTAQKCKWADLVKETPESSLEAVRSARNKLLNILRRLETYEKLLLESVVKK